MNAPTQNTTSPTTVTVDLGSRSYDILIGTGLLAQAGPLMLPLLKQKRVFIVTDSNVAPNYLKPLQASLEKAGIVSAHVIVPAGEASKDFNHLAIVLDAMLAAKCERKTMVIALGGGVIGDLAGFAASILLRGVEFIQIPTTLLSQVDSSVGGKTGINTKAGKNLVGTFHQPRLVLADTDTLSTLPRRELLAGYAEVAKYGLLGDEPFFGWLEANVASVLSLKSEHHSNLVHAIAESCRAKARIVGQDEKETGVRALLNLGHTFGHAFEAEMGYGDGLLHGEAVAMGMVLAFELSARLGLCPAADAQRARAHLAGAGLSIQPPKRGPRGLITAEALIAHMTVDKKVQDGAITFILARGIGCAFTTTKVPTSILRDVLADALAA
jgi:3-dehydroquinate synthase